MNRIMMVAVAGLCLCTQAALETAPADFKWNDWQKMRPPKSPEKRMSLIQPVKAGELRLVPTYTSCSVCWGSAPVEGLALEYRAAGGEWKKGETPIHFLDAANYRGSIFYLAEDTSYEMRLTAGGKTLAAGSFRTWKSEVPVARTIMIDPATATYPIVVSEKGHPDGWIRYTTKPGAVVGGLVLGIAESMTTGYLSGNYEDVLSFCLLILILIFRPDGILGKKQVQKV